MYMQLGKGALPNSVYVIQNGFVPFLFSQHGCQALERKADKYLKRRDVVLVSAVLRVWTSRERGLLMERAILMRRLQTAWVIWKTRLQNVRLMEGNSFEHVHFCTLLIVP